MRIRKNAKISTLFFANTNLSNDSDDCLIQQKELCQLNQSPWDIITFPPSDSSSSLVQFDDNEAYYNVCLAGNASWDYSIGASESLASVKTSEGENYGFDEPKHDYGGILGFEGGETSEIQEEIVLCGRTDDKGWQCGRLVKNGDTICDYHVNELQTNAVWTSKKSRPINGTMAGTHSRPRQNKKRASTSPYEFYYYTGFGPSWGKKRGSTATTSNTYNEIIPTDDMDIRREMEKRFEPETSKIRPTKTELMYDDDDVDDNKKGKSGIVGKKRGRKPIKARSLKSLM
ncbi:uncharacterized protein LOC112526858 [Cynara cardunculus var. scolymus]|uniref:uncharacterized protein LOC112526858 n=1 Tax=Cynara cardunculus var. scolymus TaxID=59895 RepID=UPI000D626C9C|nr:uncharacterized protein LOC112526858 [Cynara cardunculus var. scolymus]